MFISVYAIQGVNQGSQQQRGQVASPMVSEINPRQDPKVVKSNFSPADCRSKGGVQSEDIPLFLIMERLVTGEKLY